MLKQDLTSHRPAVVPRLADFDLMETPCHLIRRALKRAYDIFVEELGNAGLTPPQFTVMITVYQNPGMNQNDLVRETGSDRSTVAELVSRLVKRGYLTRRRTPRDQRANRVYVSLEGTRVLRDCLPAVVRAEDRIIEPIPVEYRSTIIAGLQRMVDAEDEELEARARADAGATAVG